MINSIAPNNNNISYSNYNIGYGEKNNISQKQGKTSQVEKTECQTCKNRKYVDGSNESNVSFKAPGHINPQNSASVVASHEREHVKNAVNEGNKKGNKLLSVSVSLKTSVCPECGRTYVSGGTTRTLTKKSIDEPKLNPYNQGEEMVKRFLMQGANIDLAA